MTPDRWFALGAFAIAAALWGWSKLVDANARMFPEVERRERFVAVLGEPKRSTRAGGKL